MTSCEECAHFGPHLKGPQEKFPEPCNECAEGEKFIEPEILAKRKEKLGSVGQLYLKNGTQWPNPLDKKTQAAMRRALHAPDQMDHVDRMRLVRMSEAYQMLILHPAFTLKEVQSKVSEIRKAINV